MDWHGPRPTKIKMIQLRRETSKPLEHEYRVLIVSDDCILRLDRRGQEPNPADPVTSGGIESRDTIANVDSLSDLDKTSYCLVELHCQDSDDVTRFSACNCYFFAWTILVVTARHAAPWDTHPSDLPWKLLSQTLADAVSAQFADALSCRVAVSRRARLAWAMPQWLIRLVLRIMIRTSLGPKIYKPLRSKLRLALLSALELTLHSAFENLRVSTLRTILWKDELDAGTKALSSIRLRKEDADAFQSLAAAFAHRDFLEGQRGHWGAACVEGFNAMVQATPLLAAGGADGFGENNMQWDEVWNSMRDSVQDACKNAMKGRQVGTWATLWDALMKEWGAAWEAISHEMRDTARVTLNEMANLVNDELADSVVDTLPDTHLHIIVTKMSDSKPVTGLPTVTHSELQQIMLKLIREHGRVDMREAMARIWRAVVQLDRGGAYANGNRNAGAS
ncbi:hypothetical protein BS47DRAFT_1397276 [Hydnum rufescens UP504]|uniref:Uncharacterized protein n=1 Tax=Hydnum rufescens UP504 TaxID=1448309 RepID=A0A9P6ANG1_9AGAM|nr:hypothetical protein BS47DRAFT_1397276 [Hydnum rufescens UP504]